MIFLFDVDGTLTPSRQKLDPEFKPFLMDFLEDNICYIVTGSDQVKTVEQLGEDVYESFCGQFQCSGNQFYSHGELLYQSEWDLPPCARDWLEKRLSASSFPIRAGNHIEQRPGSVNFSVVGRNASAQQREEYVKWDTEYSERKAIAGAFNNVFPGLCATIGGETGLDISSNGRDKSQVMRFFPESNVVFFGDAIFPGGNDWPLAELVKFDGCVHKVNGWKQTQDILKKFYI